MIDLIIALFAILLVAVMVYNFMKKGGSCDCDGCPGCSSTTCKEKVVK